MLSISAKPGDTVRVRVADGRAWLVGNDTAPPNDSSDVAYDLKKTNALITKITTENIVGENGWINLLEGTFDFGAGKLAWNGENLTLNGIIKAIAGLIGQWAINDTGLKYESDAVTTEIYPSYIYLAEFVPGSAPQVNASANYDASGTLLNKNDGSMASVKPSEVKVGSASSAYNVSLKTTSGIGGLYDNNAGKWLIRTSNAGVLIPDTFRSGGQDDPTVYRYPVQSHNGSGQAVIYLASHPTTLTVVADWEGVREGRQISVPSSDVRIKSEIDDCKVDALALIRAVKMVEFKKHGVYQPIGVIADQLEELDPRLAIGGGYDDDGTMNVKSVDTFYLQGYIVKAIQELSDRLDRLEAKLDLITEGK